MLGLEILRLMFYTNSQCCKITTLPVVGITHGCKFTMLQHYYITSSLHYMIKFALQSVITNYQCTHETKELSFSFCILPTFPCSLNLPAP